MIDNKLSRTTPLTKAEIDAVLKPHEEVGEIKPAAPIGASAEKTPETVSAVLPAPNEPASSPHNQVAARSSQ